MNAPAKVYVADKYAAEFQRAVARYGVVVVGWEAPCHPMPDTRVALLQGTPHPARWLDPIWTKHDDGSVSVDWNPS